MGWAAERCEKTGSRWAGRGRGGDGIKLRASVQCKVSGSRPGVMGRGPAQSRRPLTTQLHLTEARVAWQLLSTEYVPLLQSTQQST